MTQPWPNGQVEAARWYVRSGLICIVLVALVGSPNNYRFMVEFEGVVTLFCTCI